MEEDTEPKNWGRKGTFFVVEWEDEAQKSVLHLLVTEVTHLRGVPSSRAASSRARGLKQRVTPRKTKACLVQLKSNSAHS